MRSIPIDNETYEDDETRKPNGLTASLTPDLSVRRPSEANFVEQSWWRAGGAEWGLTIRTTKTKDHLTASQPSRTMLSQTRACT